VRKRIVSTLILWLLLLGTLWFLRTTGALILIGIATLLTQREFFQLRRQAGAPAVEGVGLLLGLLVLFSPLLELRGLSPVALPALAVVLVAGAALAARPLEQRLNQFASTVVGIVFIAGLMQFMVRIILPQPGDTITPDGRLLFAVWVIATVKFCDVGALLTGMACGRHKMAPVISPKKTWEGAVGGVIVSAGVGAGVAWLARDYLTPEFTPLYAAGVAVPVAIAGILSDLLESLIKRGAGQKDSGASIPGIGGIFDMTDSLVLALPIGYLLMRLA